MLFAKLLLGEMSGHLFECEPASLSPSQTHTCSNNSQFHLWRVLREREREREREKGSRRGKERDKRESGSRRGKEREKRETK